MDWSFFPKAGRLECGGYVNMLLGRRLMQGLYLIIIHRLAVVAAGIPYHHPHLPCCLRLLACDALHSIVNL